MLFDDARNRRIADVFPKLQSELDKKGISVSNDVSPALLLRGADFLDNPADKFAYAFFIHHIVKEPEQKAEVLAWAQKLSQQHGGNLSAIMADGVNFYTDFAKFANSVSKNEYQSFIDATPYQYLRSRDELQTLGLDTNTPPSQSTINAAIAKLPTRDYEISMLLDTTDPDLRLKIVQTFLSDNYTAKMLLSERYASAVKELPSGKKILEDVFFRLSGLDFTDDSPVAAGSVKVNESIIKHYAEQLGLAEIVKERSQMAIKKDPLFAIRHAENGYPKSGDAIPAYMSALPRIHELLNDPDHAKYLIRMLNTLEPSQYAGQSVRLIPERDIFRTLDKVTATQLYDLITQQQSSTGYEFTQGTYNELSRRLYAQLKVEGKSFLDVANSMPERSALLKKFVQTADAYRHMDNLIAATSPDTHQILFDVVFKKDEGFGLDISCLTNIITALPKGSPLLPYIESSIMERAFSGSEYDKADMGLLSRWYANQDKHKVSNEHKSFFDKVKSDPSFAVPTLNNIPAGKLLDAAGRNFQLHIFYNDKDGIDTFNSFSAALKADGWGFKKQDDFLVISKEKNGRRIEILVSPPEQDGKATPAILDYVKQKNGHISVLAGRGHAHHMANAVELITPDTKIVNLGGCWGHNYSTEVLKKSPDAHILATTGVGRMAINNLNTRWLNDQILNGRDIDWKALQGEWGKLRSDRSLAEDIRNYISPDQNIMLLYERRREELYNEIEQRESGENPASQLQNDFMNSVRRNADSAQPQLSAARPAEQDMKLEMAVS